MASFQNLDQGSSRESVAPAVFAFFFLVISKFLSVSQARLVAGVQWQKLLQALDGPPVGWVEEVIQVVGRALRENKGQEQGLIRSGKGSDFSAKPETRACKVGQLAMLCVCVSGGCF